MLQILKCIVLATRRRHCTLFTSLNFLLQNSFLKVSLYCPSSDCWVSDLLQVPQVGSSLKNCYGRQNFLYIRLLVSFCPITRHWRRCRRYSSTSPLPIAFNQGEQVSHQTAETANGASAAARLVPRPQMNGHVAARGHGGVEFPKQGQLPPTQKVKKSFC